MSPLDALAPDQRAVLQLLLKQGKRYEELATLLRIDAGAVRGRAVGALDALGPETQLVAGRRAQLTDWLLGQQDPAEAAQTLDLLETSAPARDWVTVVAAELRAADLASERMPAVPSGPAVAADAPATPEPEPAEPAAAPSAAGPPTGDEDPSSRMPGFSASGDDAGRPPVSKLGGALLLGGIVIILAVALVWALTSDGDGGGDTGTVAATSTTATATTPSEGDALVPVAQINLYPTGGGDAVGVARLYEQSGQRVVGVDAENVARNTEGDQYALWLAEGPNGRARRLGFIEKVGRKGRISVAATLPANADRFKRLVISRETTDSGDEPAEPVLTGRLRIPNG